MGQAEGFWWGQVGDTDGEQMGTEGWHGLGGQGEAEGQQGERQGGGRDVGGQEEEGAGQRRVREGQEHNGGRGTVPKVTGRPVGHSHSLATFLE